ncbi:MAG TPA: hypothetical protein VIQ98_08900, partial [Gemmatimonadales bacterium]
ADPAAGEHLEPLADLVNLARFGPAGVAESAADEAWRHCAAVDLIVRRRIGLPRRIRHRLGPRSLVG